MKRTYKTNKGYLLSEVLVSMFILMLSIAAAIGVVVYGFAAMNYNKNSMVAVMLVKECTESLIGLRDTNVLRFGYDKDNCWNVNDDICPSSNILSPGYYILEVSISGTSTFADASTITKEGFSDPDNISQMSGLPTFPTSTTNPLDLSDGVSETDQVYLLNYLDLNPLEDIDGDGYMDNDFETFTTGPGIAKSKFYRMMQITNTDGPPATFVDGLCTVAWMEGNDPKSINIPVHLTAY